MHEYDIMFSLQLKYDFNHKKCTSENNTQKFGRPLFQDIWPCKRFTCRKRTKMKVFEDKLMIFGTKFKKKLYLNQIYCCKNV